MRSQKLVLTLSAAVTGLFLATVGLVLAWPYLTATTPDQPRFLLGPNVNFNNFAPMPEPQARIDRPVVDLAAARGPVVAAKDYTLSAPQTHGNLTIFLIHGRDTLPDAKMVTLQEALEQNVAVVHETGGGQLFIDNRGNAPLFIQAGDIVKGGTQDRTLPHDMLISAHTNRAPIQALCVEQGRSFPRGNETSSSFETATEQLPGRDLRMAAYRQNQNEVWNNVKNMQNNLTRNAGGSVKATISNSSLQLSLEHQRVQAAVQDCVARLAPSIEGKTNVIGYAVAVNGKIQSADVYGSAALFQKLWPKLIRASAVAALAERQPGAEAAAPTSDAVQAFLAEGERGQAFQGGPGSRTNVIRHESGQQVLFDTCDTARGNVVVHRAFLAK